MPLVCMPWQTSIVICYSSDGSATKEPKLVDSTNKDDVAAVDSAVTPTSKSLGKRSADSVKSADDIVLIDCDKRA